MKLTEHYKVGQSVRDNKFSGLKGVIVKVTQRMVTVKMNKMTAKFQGIESISDLEIIQ